MDTLHTISPGLYTTLVEILQEKVLRQPDQVIFRFLPDGELENGSLTYRQLDQKARNIAALLREHMAEPGGRVLLLYPPGLDYVCGFWGCIYAGMVAVPSYPPRLNRPDARLQAIAKDSRARIALTTSEIASSIQQRLENAPDLAVIDWLTTENVDGLAQADWQPPQVTSQTLAFLQYTSGSTAQPKGVMVSHGNLIHNLEQIHQFFGVSSETRSVFWLPPYHDMGLIGGILEPIYTGASTLLMPATAFLQKPVRWLQAISRFRATIGGGPNFAFDLCTQKITEEQKQGLDLSCWELAFTGAEPIRIETLERFVAAFEPYGFRREALYACYGLAEATLIASGATRHKGARVSHFDGQALLENQVKATVPTDKGRREMVSCGTCAPDQKLVIVDGQTLHYCPENRIGEIWMAGPSIAQGYWNLETESAETFGARTKEGDGPYLRTGDLGFLHEGEVYVTGRSKDLIIIRGRNHYPQDIELTVESSHSSLQPGGGAAFSVDVSGEERLVLVQEVDRHTRQEQIPEIVSAVRQAVLEAHELQAHAVVLVRVGSVPKTSSGKIQRRASREQYLKGALTVIGSDTLEAQTESNMPPAAASGENNLIRKALSAVTDHPTRRILLEIYLQEQIVRVLHLSGSSVDAEQPLSMLGLDSLGAVELSYAIETGLGVSLPMAEWLAGPSVAQLVESILARFEAKPASTKIAIVQTESAGEVPLSHGQQSLWFLNQLAPESTAYNVPSAVRIRSALDIPALRRAFEKLVTRHAALRTTFEILPASTGPIQRVHAQLPLDFEVVDASRWDEPTLDAHLNREAHCIFDLARGPLLRVRVFKRAEHDHVLLMVMHHIITDFWSLAVMVEDLSRFYPAEAAGQPIVLNAPTQQYTEYVAQQARLLASPQGEELWAFWQAQLSGELPVLNLATDRPRPAVQSYKGGVLTVRLDAELTERIKALSQAHQATLNMTLTAAFQTLIYRYSGQPDFLIGSVATGRGQAGLAEVAGYFVNPIVLRAKPVSGKSFVEFLGQTRRAILDAFDHQEFPFDVLVNRLQPVRDYSRSPLFQVMFVFQRAYKFNERGLTGFSLDIGGQQMELAGLELESVALEHREAQFDLTLTMGESGSGLIASFEYNSDLYDETTIARLAAHFKTLLNGIVAQPACVLGSLPLLSGDELRDFQVDWNGTRAQASPNSTIRSLFEEQAALTPGLPAVLFEDTQLSYGDLNQKADRLAGYLRAHGVGPEVIVAVCMERSLEMIIGILAILKAGGAYAPLDPAYPAERLAFILEETNSPILLTQQHLRENLPASFALVLCLDSDWEMAISAGAQPSSNNDCSDGRCAACVIYTSGSTGKPKGVVLENRAIANLIQSFIQTYAATESDRILPLTSIGSASFVGEIFPLLCCGGALVLAPMEEFLDLDRLFELIIRQRVSIVSAVPTVIAGLNQKKGNLGTLRWLLSGGEALDIEDVDELLKSVSIANTYGLTETTVCSSFFKVNGQASGPRSGVPIGSPILNTDAYVLDPDLNFLPVGCAGELYIAGAGLARGYLANAAATAQRFVPNPFSAGERMYRTGDLARWLPGGVLEYLQRADQQVKIRGFRIELGEIEAVLKQQPGVQDALITVREDTPGDKRLVAYLLTPQPLPAGQDLRAALAEQLPGYMLPAAFETLAAWPLTPNGKIDLKALPAPSSLRPAWASQYVAPQSDVERRLASIWQSVLKVETVGIQDNFFDLGGNSLLIAQAHQRLQSEFELQIPLVELFKYPSIGLLAQWLSHREDNGTQLREQFEDEAGKRRQALNRRRQLAETGMHDPYSQDPTKDAE